MLVTFSQLNGSPRQCWSSRCRDVTHLGPVKGCSCELDDIVQVTLHIERRREAGGAREDAEVREGLGHYFVREVRDREQADGQPMLQMSISIKLINDRSRVMASDVE